MVCPDCKGDIEFKGNDVVTTCEHCGKNLQLPDEEYIKVRLKAIKRQARGALVRIILGFAAAAFICSIGFLVFIAALGMPAIYAGQYLILGIIVIISGIVMFILVRKYGFQDIVSKGEEVLQEIEAKAEEMRSHNPDPEDKAGNFCDSCGKSLKPTAKFCGECGTPRS